MLDTEAKLIHILDQTTSPDEEDLKATTLKPRSPVSLFENDVTALSSPRPPFDAEYLLHLCLAEDDRETVIGDLLESYVRVFGRFNKRRADIWFYKQVFSFIFPLFRRALLKIGALIWLGLILRRLFS